MTTLRLFLLAGEASGDLIGADLITRLKSRVALELVGVAGHAMHQNGMTSLFPITDLSVMGTFDAIRTLPRSLWRLAQCTREVLKFDPDIVVLIDSQVFSNLLARRLRKHGFTKPILLYVAPTVWVYKPERAKKIKNLYDEILSILPFEPAVMEKLSGPPTCFVGHPALREKIADFNPDLRKNIALLPGSRNSELNRHLKMFGQVANAIHQKYPQYSLYLPTLPHLENWLRDVTKKWGVPVEIVIDKSRRALLYKETRIALACAGTATLELAFAGVPLVTTFVMEAELARGYRKLGEPRIALPNIILEEDLVPEIMISQPEPEALFAAFDELMSSDASLMRQVEGFQRIADVMSSGTQPHPRTDPAERVLSHWRGNT